MKQDRDQLFLTYQLSSIFSSHLHLMTETYTASETSSILSMKKTMYNILHNIYIMNISFSQTSKGSIDAVMPVSQCYSLHTKVEWVTIEAAL
jgi:hypothetical protein